jgi:molybdate transport system regulatory protein
MPSDPPLRKSKISPGAPRKKAGAAAVVRMTSGEVAKPPMRRMRHRVMAAGAFIFGPGKADLLAAIGEMGSLAAAARKLGMSYMRAWLLVQEMQKTFAEPVVEMQRGGRAKGGATLTPTGHAALALYRKMEAEALAATDRTWRKFCGLLRVA